MKTIFHYDAGLALMARLAALAAEGFEVMPCPEEDEGLLAALLPDAEVLLHLLKPVTAATIERDARPQPGGRGRKHAAAARLRRIAVPGRLKIGDGRLCYRRAKHREVAMSAIATEPAPHSRAALPSAAREAMEKLNAEAEGLHIWLRTQANAPAQRPWFRDDGLEAGGRLAAGRVGANQMKAAAHHWRWREIGPYLDRIGEIARTADVSPIEFADRQQFLLINPGLGGRLQVASTIRCAVSIYNPGDVAPVHMHTPNASRTILSENGGYTTIEGERCTAARGDLILTPNGTWHDHGNDGATPVVWADILDFPLLEFLDCSWIDEDFPGERDGNARAQKPVHGDGYSARLYGAGGILPGFVSHRRGIGHATSPVFHYRGSEIRAALDALREEAGDPYEGITLRFANPATGASVFPTLDYGAQLLRLGEATGWKRETANAFYIVLDGEGTTELAGQNFEWRTNDLFVIPNFLWRRHINRGSRDAVLYLCSDRPLFEKIGQYCAQARTPAGTVVQLVT